MPLTQWEKLKMIRNAKAENLRKHSKKVWVEVCRRGPQTLTLFNTEIVHFATLPFAYSITYFFKKNFHHGISCFRKSNVGTKSIDRSPPTFTFF